MSPSPVQAAGSPTRPQTCDQPGRAAARPSPGSRRSATGRRTVAAPGGRGHAIWSSAALDPWPDRAGSPCSRPSPAEQGREICIDRRQLIQHGFRTVDFAYPVGSYDATTERVVRRCGDQSARRIMGLWGSGCEQTLVAW